MYSPISVFRLHLNSARVRIYTIPKKHQTNYTAGFICHFFFFFCGGAFITYIYIYVVFKHITQKRKRKEYTGYRK